MQSPISQKMLRALLLLAAPTLLQTGCGASSTSTDEGTTSTTTNSGTNHTGGTETGTTTEVNALAAAYPGTLALSVFPDSGTTLRLVQDGASKPAPTDAGSIDRPYAEKVADADKRLRGEGDCFVAGNLGERQAASSNITCYEFDSDMNPSTFADRPNQSWGTTDGTDGAGQACMVTFAKSQVDDITHKVDRALEMVQGLICAAKKQAATQGSEVETPTPGGDAIDLKALVNASLPDNAPISFSTAEMSATENADGSVTYTTAIAIVNPFGKTDAVTLRHTPATEEGGDESGVLTFQREPLGSKQPGYNPNDPNQADKKYDVMAINYKKSTDDAGENRVVAELTRASINQTYDPIDDEGLVNFAALPENAQNADINGIKYVAFDIDPDTGAGDLSYWMNPGGNLNESARGFVFNLAADAEGLLSGCGISGATANVSIRKSVADSTSTLAPQRFWHPRGNQNTSPNKDSRYPGNEGNLITEQCFKQNGTSGLYVIDSGKTTSTRGYDVKAGSASSVKPPERPPEPSLPPMPPPPKPAS